MRTYWLQFGREVLTCTWLSVNATRDAVRTHAIEQFLRNPRGFGEGVTVLKLARANVYARARDLA